SATRKSIRPPARARSGSGMPYLLTVLWPRIAANTSAKLETSVARTAMLRANLGSARSVIFAKATNYLERSEHQKKKGKNLERGNGLRPRLAAGGSCSQSDFTGGRKTHTHHQRHHQTQPGGRAESFGFAQTGPGPRDFCSSIRILHQQ